MTQHKGSAPDSAFGSRSCVWAASLLLMSDNVDIPHVYSCVLTAAVNYFTLPQQLEMEDEDTIDVFQQQTGGLC